MPIRPETRQSLLRSARTLEWSLNLQLEELPLDHPNRRKVIARRMKLIYMLREAAALAPDSLDRQAETQGRPPRKEDFIWAPWMKRGKEFQEAYEIAMGLRPDPDPDTAPKAMTNEEYLGHVESMNHSPVAQACLAILERYGVHGDPSTFHPVRLMNQWPEMHEEDWDETNPRDQAQFLVQASIPQDAADRDFKECLRWSKRIEWLLGPGLDMPERFSCVEEAGGWLLDELARIMDEDREI